MNYLQPASSFSLGTQFSDTVTTFLNLPADKEPPSDTFLQRLSTTARNLSARTIRTALSIGLPVIVGNGVLLQKILDTSKLYPQGIDLISSCFPFKNTSIPSGVSNYCRNFNLTNWSFPVRIKISILYNGVTFPVILFRSFVSFCNGDRLEAKEYLKSSTKFFLRFALDSAINATCNEVALRVLFMGELILHIFVPTEYRAALNKASKIFDGMIGEQLGVKEQLAQTTREKTEAERLLAKVTVERNEALERLDRVTVEKDQEIDRLSQVAREKVKEIGSLKQEIAKKDSKIIALEAKYERDLSQIEEKLNNLRALLGRKGVIKKGREIIQSVEALFDDLTQGVSETKASNERLSLDMSSVNDSNSKLNERLRVLNYQFDELKDLYNNITSQQRNRRLGIDPSQILTSRARSQVISQHPDSSTTSKKKKGNPKQQQDNE